MSDKKTEQEIDEPVINICKWITYANKRCRKITDKDFCRVHHKLLEDYEYLESAEDADGSELVCETASTIKVVPRSREHLVSVMKKIGLEEELNVEIIFPGGSIESGEISAEDYIEMFDKTRYYYENDSKTKGLKKTKDIKVILEKYCQEDPVVRYNEVCYCKECYVKESKKNGYPTLNTIKNK